MRRNLMKQIMTDQEYQEQINQDQLTVGIFTTTWCPDCKRLGMFIDEITEENQDKQWFTIDRDDFPEVSEEQNVMGIPSLLVLKTGKNLHICIVQMPKRLIK